MQKFFLRDSDPFSDPNVEVIYIWPWKFGEDTEKYYMKLLDLSDKKESDAEPPSKRCTLLSPESSHRFPVSVPWFLSLQFVSKLCF